MGQKSSIKLPERGMNESVNEHKKIFDAILRKNPVKAEENAKKHMQKTKKAVLQYFDNLKMNPISDEEVRENLINQISANGEIIDVLGLTTNN